MIDISSMTAFLMTAFSLAELGDGFGMFFDMYLLGLGWTETAVILSGIFRGVVDLSLKGIVGDIIDKTHHDRRIFLAIASMAVAASSCMVFVVNGADNFDKFVVFSVRSIESVALAFLGPAFAAITLSAFGPELFDQMQVQRELVSHAGSILSAILSGTVAWCMYPDIQLVFILPSLFAVSAIFFVRYIPRGDPLMGRGFHGKTEKRDDQGCVVDTHESEPPPPAASYMDVFLDRRILWITVADVFHVLAEANVGLVFNELLAGVGTYSNNNKNGGGGADDDDYNDVNNYDDDNVMSRSAIPLLATAGTAAQSVMIAGTFLVGYLTERGWGRKPFYVLHLSIHPIRVALLLLCLATDAGSGWLVSTELVGGLTGAFGIVNAFMRADILFGSGRFNVVDGFQATIRGIAATSSSYVGAYILEKNGPTTALAISFIIAIIPPMIGAIFVPETLGMRQIDFNEEKHEEKLRYTASMMEKEETHHPSTRTTTTTTTTTTSFGYLMMSLSGEVILPTTSMMQQQQQQHHQQQHSQSQQQQQQDTSTYILEMTSSSSSSSSSSSQSISKKSAVTTEKKGNDNDICNNNNNKNNMNDCEDGKLLNHSIV